MPTFKKGDRVRYVGRSDHPSHQRKGDLGTVVWAGDIPRIMDTTLRDWVRVKWDEPALGRDAASMAASEVRIADQ